MKKQNYLILAIALIGLAIACSPKTTGGTAAAPSGKNIETPAGKRKFIDAANMDASVRPQDDFYAYANGAWLKATAIPAAENAWGSFLELRDFNANALKTICEETAANPGAKGSLSQKVGDFYASGMDEAAIEKAGFSPIKADLARINSIKNYTGLIEEINFQYSEGNAGIFGLGARTDAKDAKTTVAHISQGGTSLPDRDYYLVDNERFKKIKTAYETQIVNCFKLIGDSDAKAKQAMADIMKMEKAFAQAQQSRVERRDPDKRYNKMSLADLEKMCPQMSWEKLLKGAGAISPYYIVDNPKFFTQLNDALKNGQLEDWKNYLRWQAIQGALPYLSSPFIAEGFKMQQATTGAKEMQPRWKRVSRMTDGVLGEALGQVYVDRHFKPEAKKRMLELVGNLMKIYEKRINSLEWMSPETKKQALQKLATYGLKIGYPDQWFDYTPLSIDRAKSYYDNVEAAGKFRYKYMMSRIGQPVDKNRWGMSPPTVNAYYNSSLNEIVFPAGILQFPFFDNEADDAVNYGGIGAVIGHEISHGFDDQGSKFDSEGNLKNWWTDSDRKQFDSRANQIVEQYNKCRVLDTIPVNGKLTLGENIADFGGLSVSYEAFKTFSPQAKSMDKIDGFTADQRFFLSWAQIWRSKHRNEALANQVQTDPHSPGIFRCNVPLSNMPEFYQIFGVKAGDKMYRADADRVKIW